jgi:putative FmdB family regulatory protein
VPKPEQGFAMPTYVYECAKCGDEFELWQSFSDEPLKKHSGCGGKVTKVLQPVGIVLKGSGFYKTDNRGSSKSTRPETSSSESSGSPSDKSSSDKSSDKSSSGKSSSDKSSSTKKSDSKSGDKAAKAG